MTSYCTNPSLAIPRMKNYSRILTISICSKNYHETYQNLLNLYQVPTLQNRRLFLRLCTFYSIVNKLVFFTFESVLPSTMSATSSRCRNYNRCVYRVPRAHLNSLKFSFFLSTINVWNNLPCIRSS